MNLSCIHTLVALPKHNAFYLARYQASRMNFLARTTPKEKCGRALATYDTATRRLVESLIGRDLTDEEWDASAMPYRDGGLGLQCVARVADAAYVASRAKTQERLNAVYSRADIHDPADDFGDAAIQRISSHVVGVEINLDDAAEDGEPVQQRALSSKMVKAAAARQIQVAGPLARINIIAQRAPGAGRWLLPAPTDDR